MKKLYRNYDQDGLDAQYNLRPSVPHHPQIFERYIRDSAAVLETEQYELDLAYGETPAQKLDLFLAKGISGPAPIVTFIHGGYWRNKDKSDWRYLAPAFTNAGVHLALVNYTLAPEASMDQIVDENRRAISWLADNVSGYGGDPSRILITGHSAGGHLVGMMMATDWAAFTDGAHGNDIIAGGTAISGLFDLEPIRLCYLNETLGLDPETAHRNSPINLEPVVRAPLILSLGALETDEYHRQQSSFEKKWREQGCELSVVEMPALHHYDVIDHLGLPGSALHQAVMRQVADNSGT